MAKEATQIKFTIDTGIVVAFKQRCASEGVSMASVVRKWMAVGGIDAKPRIETVPQRRKAVADMIDLLSDILEIQEQYRDSIPEQFAQRYESADRACGQLAEAINCLEDAF
jgi:hypothetical protein